MLSVFPAHAPADALFARELSAFLESGCDVVCSVSDAAIKPGQDLLSSIEVGLSADVLILVLSPASNLTNWSRERWAPLLFERATELNTRVAVVLIEECGFPPLLRRGASFFNATEEPLTALRQLKRWIWSIPSGVTPGRRVSPDLDTFYRSLADRPGTFTGSGALAQRFAREAAREFEAVFWIPAHGRTLSQIAGELGARMKMTLDGMVEDNCRRIRERLFERRCLLVLDAPEVGVETLIPSGRASVLVTTEPVELVDNTVSFEGARQLVRARRFAEAYDALRHLLDSGIEPMACVRDLVWICEHWDRLDEANTFRYRYGPEPTEQLHLF